MKMRNGTVHSYFNWLKLKISPYLHNLVTSTEADEMFQVNLMLNNKTSVDLKRQKSNWQALNRNAE